MRWLVALALLVTASCVPDRQNPPSLSWLANQDVHEGMHALAVEAWGVNEILSGVAAPSTEEREAVVAHLDEMIRVARSLNVAENRARHPILGENLDRFAAGVAGARAAVRRDPPNYFLAASVTGTCMQCHGQPRPGG